MQKIYSKNREENMKGRAKLLLKARSNPELQMIIKKKCDESILFFFNMFLYTYKPKAVWNEMEPLSPHFPFITYDFQDRYILDIVKCIESWTDNITEKSREMWFTWMILWIALRGLLFKWRGWLIWSYKEDAVDRAWDMDSNFERLRYMLDRLPHYLKPNDLICKFMSISSKELWASISWDAGEAFWTWWRRKWVFLDEFSLWRMDTTAFRKTKDITNCRIFGGTPEWKWNVYWKIMTNHPDYTSLKIKKFRLHWTEHPLKTKDWYEKQKTMRTKLDIAQELDICYDNSLSGAVYSDFDKLVTFKELTYNPKFKLYTSWDFGRDSNVVQVWQKDFQFNRLYLLTSFRRINRHIKQFASLLIWTPIEWFTYTEDDLQLMDEMKKYVGLYSGHFWDPYNSNAKTTNADKTIKEILWTMWIYLTLKTWTTIESRITDTKLALNRVTIDYEKNIDLIESMRQSRYPRYKEWYEEIREKTKPVHDANSHHRTAFEYFIDNEPKILFENTKTEKKGRVYVNRMTWEVVKVKDFS